jgi:hypothetical protein
MGEYCLDLVRVFLGDENVRARFDLAKQRVNGCRLPIMRGEARVEGVSRKAALRAHRNCEAEALERRSDQPSGGPVGGPREELAASQAIAPV